MLLFQTLAQREANQLIRKEWERQKEIREEKEAEKRDQNNLQLEKKMTERLVKNVIREVIN